MSRTERMPVGVLGATGSVGQRFITLLADHPWFEIAALTASERSAGKSYGEAVQWMQRAPLPERVSSMSVRASGSPLEPRLLFSALDGGVAGPIEAELAREGHLVVSNARSHRMDEDVPLLVPEVNAEHLDLVEHQSFGEGAIITNPNCSTIGLVLALKPLYDAFGLDRVNVVTMQAVSGAGVPGVPGLAIIDNVVPFIPGEEQKMESETLKVLGRLEERAVRPAAVTVSAQCNRVPVLDGHTECVSVSLERGAMADEVRSAWSSFRGAPQSLELPSAPKAPVRYVDDGDQPQPRQQRDRDGGMSISVGRLRPCPVLDYKFVTVSHNTIRGAAGGAILCAELAVARGLLAGVKAPAAAAS